MIARILVVAKAPVPGRVKTRLGVEVGMERAAELAAAALLDTIVTCTSAVGAEHCRLALEGELEDGVYADRLGSALDGWAVFAQRGKSFGERLANAHLDVAHEGPAVQIGMDTPQLTTSDLHTLSDALGTDDALLADAADGGWWALGLAEPRHGAHLSGVPMSTPSTGAETRRVLEGAGLRVGRGKVLRDVDTVRDAEAVAARCGPQSAFAQVWRGSR